MGEMRNAHNILVGNPEGKTQIRMPRRRWEENIRMILGKNCGNVWTGCIWYRTETSGVLL
jgi:hypothetical protein